MWAQADSVPVGQATPIDVLHNDVLLEIFDFHVSGDTWQSLVHVCRRWRSLVFGSPRRLNLELICMPRTPVRESLDIWPALPLSVKGTIDSGSTPVDNIVAALGRRDRVRRIHFDGVIWGSQWDKVLAAMQAPFPALIHLHILLQWHYETAPVIPDTFLGGSAPRLQYLNMHGTPFPGITNLLLSPTHLVNFYLNDIALSGYISPEAMATCLSMLTSLKTLSLSFDLQDPQPRRHPPPMTRSLLPGLTTFWFEGDSEYLDDLVARIDAPRLHYLFITFFLVQLNLDTPHLVQFISRTPRFQEPNEARVTLDVNADVELLWPSDARPRVRVAISQEGSEADLEISTIAQVCAMCLPPLPTVENLQLDVFTEYDVENDQWLELLRPFTAVKSLYLSKVSAPGVAAALQELIGSRITEVLPSLQNIFVEGLEPSGPLRENIGQFVIARQLSDRPIAICDWHKLQLTTIFGNHRC
jgi:hypothetical protein